MRSPRPTSTREREPREAVEGHGGRIESCQLSAVSYQGKPYPLPARAISSKAFTIGKTMYRALVLYHYFHPDDVVSSTHVSELAEGLVQRGWHVTAMPCNRGCRDESLRYPPEDKWNGVHIR